MLLFKAFALLLSFFGLTELGFRYTQNSSPAMAVQTYASRLSRGVLVEGVPMEEQAGAPRFSAAADEEEEDEDDDSHHSHHPHRHHGHHHGHGHHMHEEHEGRSHKSGKWGHSHKSGKWGHSHKFGKGGHSHKSGKSGHSHKKDHSHKSGKSGHSGHSHGHGHHHGHWHQHGHYERDGMHFSPETFAAFAGTTPAGFLEQMQPVRACHYACGKEEACHAKCPKPWQPMLEQCDLVMPAMACHRECRHSRSGRECHKACPAPPASSKFAPTMEKTRACHQACAEGDHECHHNCPHTMCFVGRMCGLGRSILECHQACPHGDRECHRACPKLRELWGSTAAPLHV